MNLEFTILKDLYSIFRLDENSDIPEWVFDSQFYSITKTSEELSVVCRPTDNVQSENMLIDKQWRIFRINGPIDLSQVGIIAHVSGILNNENIGIFPIATYDTDYILIRNNNTSRAIAVLENEGHKVLIEK